MSMEFGNDNEIKGGGGAMMGLLAGSMMNRDKDDGKTTLLAAIVFVIVFIIAIIAFAMMFKDNRRDNIGGGTDIAAILATVTAAKSMDNGSNNSNFDMAEIKAKLEHNEDRAQARQTQSELGALGLMLQKTASDNENTILKEVGEVKASQAMQSEALRQILTVQNNTAIINGVIQQLTCGQRLAC